MFLCNHGYFRSNCETCSFVDESVEDISLLDESDDWLYDFYLDRDERQMREEEYGEV